MDESTYFRSRVAIFTIAPERLVNWGQGQLKLTSWAILQFRQLTWM
jgi:hypothetical protein